MRSLNNVREVVPNVRSPALVHIPINGELANEDTRTADVVVEAEVEEEVVVADGEEGATGEEEEAAVVAAEGEE